MEILVQSVLMVTGPDSGGGLWDTSSCDPACSHVEHCVNLSRLRFGDRCPARPCASEAGRGILMEQAGISLGTYQMRVNILMTRRE